MRFSTSKSARSIKWPDLILPTSFSGMGEYPGPTINGLFCDCTKVVGNEEPIANAGVKDCPAADSDPFGALRAPDNDGVPVIDVAGKEELPNVQWLRPH